MATPTTSRRLPGWARQVTDYYQPPPRRYPTPADLARTLDPGWRSSPAIDLINTALVELMDPASPHDALAVFIPPQEGKSTLVSRRFTEWLLDHDPALAVAIVSYEQDMALRWGREIKNDIAHAGDRLAITIRADSKAAGRWDTPQGGGVYCVGIGGPLTGRPADVLIVDDPVKDRAAAESAVIRKTTWEWWESVALSRLAPGARTCLIQTRWHESDLAGRILSQPSPLRWRVISVPAIATGPDDPLRRAPGGELPSVRQRGPGYFTNLRANLSPYVFSSIYQQAPTAAEGNFFRRAAFRYWRPMPPWPDGRERIDCEGQPVTLADCWTFATADVAASTKTQADYTVIAAWAVSVSGDLILLDRVRRQVAQHDHFTMAGPLLRRWRIGQIFVEKHFFASTLIEDARQAGYPIAEVKADVDKLTRAVPAAGRVHAGRVWFPAAAEWIDEWADELASFPQGTHDDQVDVLAYAARIVSHEWAPAPSPPRPGLGSYERAIASAHQAATGDGERADYMNMDLG